MNTFLRKAFGLTDSGAKAVKVASFTSLLVNLAYMSIMMIVMYFVNNNLKGIHLSPWFYAAISVIFTIITYLAVDLEYVRTYNATYEEAANLRLEIAKTIKELPVSYFSRHNLSDVAQTIMSDVADIEHAVSHSVPRIIGSAYFLVTVGVLLLIANLYLGLAVIIPLLLSFAMVYFTRLMQQKESKKYFDANRENVEAFQEAIELQREIKSYGLVEKNYQKISALLSSSEKIRIRSEIGIALPLLISESFMKLTIGIVTVVAGILLKANAIEIIYIVSFLLASIRLIDAISAVEANFAEIQYIDSRVKRINELRQHEKQLGEDVELKNYDIELRDVSFAYNDGEQVINQVSFIAKQDEVTAIVGPSGCGKSTILRLVSRLYDYDDGEILIDGHHIKNISTDSLFGKVSFVFQDVVLFNASIMDNIRMGRENASDEEVKEAARMANCTEFIEKLPEGFDTFIGENGSRLSGGERQRISIARAFLKNSPILLLDEISASLDVENEMKIQESLNQLAQNKTVIIVSHRLKSIEKVDKIVVMNNGQVDSIGTHKELLKKSDIYRRLIEKSNLTEEFSY